MKVVEYFGEWAVVETSGNSIVDVLPTLSEALTAKARAESADRANDPWSYTPEEDDSEWEHVDGGVYC